MKTEIIKKNKDLSVANSFNDYNLKGLGTHELQSFMLLCSLYDPDTDIDFVHVDLANFIERGSSIQSRKEAIAYFDKISDKLDKIKGTFRNQDGDLVKGTLFTTFLFKPNSLMMRVRVNPDLRGVLIDVKKNYTRLDLLAIYSLKNPYSIRLYRKLKQYESTGRYCACFDDFCQMMAIPESYRKRDILSKIIKPATEELEPYFPNLACVVDRFKGTYNNVTFTFDKVKRKARIEERKEQRPKNIHFDNERGGNFYGQLEEIVKNK